VDAFLHFSYPYRMNRILIVEDEESLREALALNLELEGYEVVAVENGHEALAAYRGQSLDLIVLDLMLPGMSGMEICAAIRLENPDLPILMLTARDSPDDRVKGLKMGADDYLTKPFVLEELLLRVANLLKRSRPDKQSSSDTERYSFGANEIDFQAYQATTPQGIISLTKKECALLRLFIDRPDEVISRQQILQIVWGYDIFPSTRTMDNFILQFRKYFETDPKTPLYFHSIRGVGYKFTPLK
jgi:two-component system, OmpR family, alkaline phosphatase synthesis response regulator PhoP